MIPDFFYFYKKNFIAFGYEGMNILLVQLDNNKFPIYEINYKKTKSDKDIIAITNTCDNFIKKLIPEKQ